MKDITLLFSVSLALVLGVLTLDRGLDRVSDDAARRASLDLPGFYTSIETALSSARHEDKPLVLVFGRQGHPDTAKFKSDILSSSTVNAIKESFVWAYLDLEQPRHQAAASQFDIFDTPVTCVLDPEGNVLQRVNGISSAYLFAKQIQRSIPSRPGPSQSPASEPLRAPEKNRAQAASRGSSR